MAELKFMSKKKEESVIWIQKAIIVESQMNLLFPKFASKSYPHHMMKLQLASTIITIHLGLMIKLCSGYVEG